FLAGPETITVAWGPVVLAATVGDRHVVPGVEHDEALRMIDDPHAHRDRDIARLLLRDARYQVRDGEGAEHPARRPVESLDLGCRRGVKGEHQGCQRRDDP